MGIAFLTIYVSDLKKSKEFYLKAAQLKCGHEFSPRPGFSIAFLGDKNETLLELIEDKSTEKQISISPSSSMSIGFHTDNAKEKQRRLSQDGISSQLITVPNGVSMVNLIDPDGYAISFVQN